MMADRRGVLGKGLSALIQDAALNRSPDGLEIRDIPLGEIGFNPHQPRKHFDPAALAELSESIKQVGILQPVLVRELGRDERAAFPAADVKNAAEGADPEPAVAPRYVVVAGERRVRAARLAGLASVPAIPCSYAETEALRVALLENIQRQDLGPIEESEAFRELLGGYGATQEELAAKLGKSRSTIANSLRLLTLEEPIRELLQAGSLTRGHAKALLGMDEGPPRLRLARLCVSRGLSVRECERRVQGATAARNARRRRARAGEPAAAENPAVRALRERAEAHFGSPVNIQYGPDGKGEVRVGFYSDRDLERVLAMMGVDANLE